MLVGLALFVFPQMVQAQTAWNATDWTEYDTITIDHTNIGDDLTDFPVYVDLADLSADFWSTTPTGSTTVGTDIRVTTNDGTLSELPRELVAASSTAETGELHFKADSISSTTATTFRIYYNGTTTGAYAASDTYGAQNVWDTYGAVWHMDDRTASDQLDSSLNANTAVQAANGTDALGRLGPGLEFNGNGRYDLNDNITDNGDRGFSFWYFKRDVAGFNTVFGSASFGDGFRHLNSEDTLFLRVGGSAVADTGVLAAGTIFPLSGIIRAGR